jgi:hypothetical protein
VIDAELSMKDHSSIPATAIGRGLKPLDVKIDSEPPKQIKLVVEKKKDTSLFL